ncbi:FAD-dependent oxidoreductase [Bosea vestrisii]|uniref:FAD-dependent oxidoreductase n=1 Tax=Bosea vestrisii TaxID=151416 RepID=A0ABW0HBG6_9HYPH
MTHDLIIIGAGPAGMAAALAASKLGLKTAVLDEQSRPGGQIYRNVGDVAPQAGRLLGPDYLHGRPLAARFLDAGVDRHLATMVWDIAQDLTVSAMAGGRGFQLRAPQLIAATGAMERASPLPGWTLPGVLNAGAAQIALKSSGSIPSGRIVLAGCGPLLLLVACQLLAAGANIAAIVETAPAANRWAALREMAGALFAPKLLAKGLAMIRQIRRARVPWFAEATDVEIEGDERAAALRFIAAGEQKRIAADIVLLHHGVVPNTQISRLLRVEHAWVEAQQAWKPQLNGFGETELSGFRIAGDGGGIAGALAAEASGELAAIGAAHALGRVSSKERDRLAKTPRRVLQSQLRIRPFLDALYRPPDWITAPSGGTIICRCEEVSAQEISRMVELGCLGPNQTKFFSRCGMGPCQGRICGLSVTGILTRELSTTPATVGAYRIRSPLKPVPLATIGNIALEKEQVRR